MIGDYEREGLMGVMKSGTVRITIKIQIEDKQVDLKSGKLSSLVL